MRARVRALRLTEPADCEGDAEPCPLGCEAVAVGDGQESEDDDGDYGWSKRRCVKIKLVFRRHLDMRGDGVVACSWVGRIEWHLGLLTFSLNMIRAKDFT
jgi:hypothetical protein